MPLWTRQLARRLFLRIDKWYGHNRELSPLGPVLLIGREQYQGEAREFADGTRLNADEPIGVLHFNNHCIANLQEDHRQVIGVKFARLFRDSLHTLAERAQLDPAMRDVAVYHGLTWFSGHGDKVGFVSEPLPANWRRTLLAHYFRLLAWGYSPVKNRRSNRRSGALLPRRFWITRNALIKHFGNAQS